jgi:hypothetical protein
MGFLDVLGSVGRAVGGQVFGGSSSGGSANQKQYTLTRDDIERLITRSNIVTLDTEEKIEAARLALDHARNGTAITIGRAKKGIHRAVQSGEISQNSENRIIDVLEVFFSKQDSN